MELFDLKVINRYGRFKDLMLNLFYNNVLAVEKLQAVSGAKSDRIRPSFLRHIKRVRGCCRDLLAVHRYMYKLTGFLHKGVCDFLQRSFTGFGIVCIYLHTDTDILYSYTAFFGRYLRSGNKTGKYTGIDHCGSDRCHAY